MSARGRMAWWRAPGLAGVAIVAGAGCAPGPIDPIDIDPRSLSQDLIAYWSFDDGSGSTLHDRSGHQHDGAITGGTWISDGAVRGALRFNKAGGVTVPAFPQPSPTDSWTVTAWVRPAATTATGPTYATLVANELLREGGWELNVRYPTDPVYHFGFFVGPTDADYVYWDCQCVQLSAWRHLAAVLDTGAHTLSFYRDGHLEGVKPAPGLTFIKTGTSTLYLARWPVEAVALAVALGLEADERHLDGDLDEVTIYRRPLGPGEIAALAHGQTPQ